MNDLSDEELQHLQNILSKDSSVSTLSTKLIGESLDDHIKNHVLKLLNSFGKVEISDVEFIETDSFAEIVEKLCIVHIRMWYLEDAIGAAITDKEIADLKKKVDICFKVKRPKFVAALNKLIEGAVLKNKQLSEESVKLYKGHQS